MKRRLKRFVSNWVNYAFPDIQQKLSWNFANTSPRISKFAGMNGGFDEYVGNPAPSETGSVQMNWTLIAPSYGGLRQMKDDAQAMAGSGVGYLLSIPQDQSDETRGLRWTAARSNSIAIPEEADQGLTSLEAEATFQAAESVWYGIAPHPDELEPNRLGQWHLNDALELDSGYDLPGPRLVETYDPAPSLIQIDCVNRGNHATYPTIRIRNAAGNFLGMRLVLRGIVQDAFEWTGALTSLDTLIINCKDYSVTKSGLLGDHDAYSGLRVVAGAGFIELPAGHSLLEIYGNLTPLDISLSYYDAWY